MCNANKLPLFAGVFSTPYKSSRTTASLPYTFNVHCTFGGRGGYALGAQVRRYAANPTFGSPHAFHNALTIVRAAPDWPTLVHVVHKNYVITDFGGQINRKRVRSRQFPVPSTELTDSKSLCTATRDQKLCIIGSECH